jgi:hypothetical protein
MENERPGNTVPATALVHKVYCRLVEVNKVEWRERAQFFAIVAQMMRRIPDTRQTRVLRKNEAEWRPE